MIKAEDGKVIFRGKRSHVVAEAVTILSALKESLSEEEYKTVIRLADKSEEQVKDEAERMREKIEKTKEELKRLLEL